MTQKKTANRKKEPLRPLWVRMLRKIIFIIAGIVYVVIGIVAVLAIGALIQFTILAIQLHIDTPQAAKTASAPSEAHHRQVLLELAEAMPHLKSSPTYSATYDTCYLDLISQKLRSNYWYNCARVHIDLLEDTENQSDGAYSPGINYAPPTLPYSDYRLSSVRGALDDSAHVNFYVKSPDRAIPYYDAVTTEPALSPHSGVSVISKDYENMKRLEETGRSAIDQDKTYVIVNSSYVWYKKDIACSMFSPIGCQPPIPLDFSALR